MQSRSGSCFETDWENYQNIPLSDGTQIYAPWGNTSSGALDEATRKDIKKEDGWVMVMHTFNEPSNQVEQLRYMIFYNQTTGMLKVFYYHDAISLGYNNGFWQVKLTESNQAITNTTGAITVPSGYKNPPEFKWTCSMPYETPDGALSEGWNAFSMPLAYDPALAGPLTIYISTFARTEWIFNASSIILGDLKGTIVSDNTSNPFDGLKNTVASMSAEKAQDWANKNFSKSESESRSIATSIAGQAIGSLVKSGVSKLFSRITGKFTSHNSSVQQINLQVKLNGTYTGNVTGFFPTGGKKVFFPIGEQQTGVKLGAWNLEENPTIYIHPVGVIKSIYGDPNQSDEQDYQFCASGNYNIKTVINPQLEKHLIKYWTECTHVYENKHHDDYLPCHVQFTDFGSIGTYGPAYTSVINDIDASDNTVSIKYIDTNDSIKNDSTYYTLFSNKCKAHVTMWQLWSKYGKPTDEVPLYKYVYAPDNIDNIRGRVFKYDAKGHYLKVAMYMVTNFEGKRDTVVDMRTFIPRFEWDPKLCDRYEYDSMQSLQRSAANDATLKSIDKKVIENY